MNLITETRNKLSYQIKQLEDLQYCLSDDKLTKDARNDVEDEITKAKRNIKYYEEIMKLLEESN